LAVRLSYTFNFISGAEFATFCSRNGAGGPYFFAFAAACLPTGFACDFGLADGFGFGEDFAFAAGFAGDLADGVGLGSDFGRAAGLPTGFADGFDFVSDFGLAAGFGSGFDSAASAASASACRRRA